MSKQAEQTEVLDKPISDMSIEELQSAYNNSLDDGETEQSEPETNDDVTLSEKAEKKEDPVKSDDSSVEDSNDSKSKQIEALSKQMEGIQKLLSKWGNEVSEIRKLKESIQDSPKAKQPSDDEDDPYVVEVVEKKLRAKEEKARADAERLENTKSYMETKVPGFSGMMNEMVEGLKEVLAEEPEVDVYVNNFKANPYTSVDPLTLLYMGRNASLQKEINELKAQLSNTGSSKRDLIKKVNNLSSTRGVVSNGSNASVSGAKATLSARQIENMSIEELQKAYRQETEDL